MTNDIDGWLESAYEDRFVVDDDDYETVDDDYWEDEDEDYWEGYP